MFLMMMEILGKRSIPEFKRQVSMAIHIIPVHKLSAKVLKGVIEEFISRNGTDYGAIEPSLETSFQQVKKQDQKRIRRSCFVSFWPVFSTISAKPD